MQMIVSICQHCDEQQFRNTVTIFSGVKFDLCIRALLLHVDHILALKKIRVLLACILFSVWGPFLQHFSTIMGAFLICFTPYEGSFSQCESLCATFSQRSELFLFLWRTFFVLPLPPPHLRKFMCAPMPTTVTVHTTTVLTTVIVLTTLNVPTTCKVTVYVIINILLIFSCSNFISFHLI